MPRKEITGAAEGVINIPMINSERYKKITLAAVFCALVTASACVSCEKKDESTVSSSSSVSATEPDDTVDLNGTTLYWMADYDLNPTGGEKRSTALALFEDSFGAKIEWIPTTPETALADLQTRVNSGEPVDMFACELDGCPNGLAKGLFAPLDDYFDILEHDTELWDDVRGISDSLEYMGQHYVVPFSVSDPYLLTYSRKLMKDNKLSDPYELYKKGEWDYDAMTEMMDKFIYGDTGESDTGDGEEEESAPEPIEGRHGICGAFGRAALHSGGGSVIKLVDGKFTSGLYDDSITQAGKLIEKLSSGPYYDSGTYTAFPSDMSCLFFSSTDWTLRASNSQNKDAGIMVVPFPKAPGSEDYHVSCDYNARLLVNGSANPEAVATYIKCERLAVASEESKAAAKKAATKADKTSIGDSRGALTEEQYDAIQSYLDPGKCVPVSDLAYGMGDAMYSGGAFTFEAGGVMNRLESGLAEYPDTATDWETLVSSVSASVTNEVDRLNSGL